MNIISTLFMLSIFITCIVDTKRVPVCPNLCPPCTKCNPKKGTCTEPLDFVNCTTNAVSGVCFAGTCNTKISLPIKKASNQCQTYSCPVSGVCKLKTAPDGTDCTPLNAIGYEAVCIKGACKPVWLGVTEEMPIQNIGCVGKANGVMCDTNHVITDGETCQNGICRYPDGSYYGYIPVV